MATGSALIERGNAPEAATTLRQGRVRAQRKVSRSRGTASVKAVSPGT